MSLVELQSKDHRDLLDTIDRVRSKGVGKYVDLPQIIVCGDQSAGKSSVLEAISGMSFPTKDNLCTRFPTELILRRDTISRTKISIIPGPERSEEESERLKAVQFELSMDQPDISTAVEKAKTAMGISESKVFSTDVLRVELCGPDQPHLTLVDLPGLFRAGNKDQSLNDAATVAGMVQAYMRRPRSIILTVVSAKSDYALQEVTELARELDPGGIRTLGLITKPDTLDIGSDSEAAYIKLAQNKDVVFRLGWHVLKNRTYETRHISSAERDLDEARFFSQGNWTSVNPQHLGAKNLTSRLSSLLRDLILSQLPGLLKSVDDGIAACQLTLHRLGSSRTTLQEQQRYLLRVSRDFSSLMQSAVNAPYHYPFFGSAKTEEGYQKRIRAVVQNILVEFSHEMRLHGHARRIVDEPSEEQDRDPGIISRSDFLLEIRDLMRRTRGCELPATFNPLIVGELFAEQCKPWLSITEQMKDDVLDAVFLATKMMLEHVAVPETSDSVFEIIARSIENLKHATEQKIAEILQPHLDGHPITYNHYLVDNVQKAQEERHNRQLERSLQNYLGSSCLNGSNSNVSHSGLLLALQTDSKVDMETFACETALDYLQAYSKVAEKKFVDDVSVLAIEQQLIRKLPLLFTSEMVFNLSEREIHKIAAESDWTAVEREKCTVQLAVLQDAHSDLRRLDKHKSIAYGTVSHDLQSSTSTARPVVANSEVTPSQSESSEVVAPNLEEYPAVDSTSVPPSPITDDLTFFNCTAKAKKDRKKKKLETWA
ncbi:Hypothetical protein R9X50_00602900 [Acrodontium crateriforme]|uniref:Interferon-induced GTP-binding protein Mx n=1 Tax=Acrodontium crateriforme TaxID=150365 RepID=A0AAQ3M982_9PEZI|nr:Hypothetical protein R9X50_00602900 [Acrodontium crateriforme]